MPIISEVYEEHEKRLEVTFSQPSGMAGFIAFPGSQSESQADYEKWKRTAVGLYAIGHHHRKMNMWVLKNLFMNWISDQCRAITRPGANITRN